MESLILGDPAPRYTSNREIALRDYVQIILSSPTSRYDWITVTRFQQFAPDLDPPLPFLPLQPQEDVEQLDVTLF
jgi:hypothetical protein